MSVGRKELAYVPSPKLSAERENRVDDLDLPTLYWIISAWIEERPLLRWSDRRLQVVRNLIMGEIQEFLAEYPHHTNDGPVWNDVYKEIMDVLFFNVSLLSGNQVEVDPHFIRHGLNGQGDSFGVYYQMIQIAGNMSQKTYIQDSHQLMILWVSAISRLPISREAKVVLRWVIQKNTGNYPKSLMQVNGMKEDEYEAAFQHRIRCLRLIRHANKLRGAIRPHGLEYGDYADYKQDILDHLHNEASWLALVNKLALRYKLDRNALLSIEGEVHKAVPGIMLTNQPGYESPQLAQLLGELVQLSRTQVSQLPVAS